MWNNIYDAYWVGWDAETAGAAGAAGAGLSPEGPYRHYAINNKVRILVNIINETQSIQSWSTFDRFRKRLIKGRYTTWKTVYFLVW